MMQVEKCLMAKMAMRYKRCSLYVLLYFFAYFTYDICGRRVYSISAFSRRESIVFWRSLSASLISSNISSNGLLLFIRMFVSIQKICPLISYKSLYLWTVSASHVYDCFNNSRRDSSVSQSYVCLYPLSNNGHL